MKEKVVGGSSLNNPLVEIATKRHDHRSMISVLNEGQLKRLSEHKYSAQCSTILDPYFQVYWRWLVEQLPLWLAPNTITFTGLAINVLTTMILICYCPQARGEAPGFAHILAGLGFFVYQSMDAVDGKQARRTSSSSPLGELVDHGCDAISLVMVSLGVCIALELGKMPAWMFFYCFIASFLFYCAHWQSYVTGTLKFGKVDCTELQCVAMIIFIITGILGVSVWEKQVFGLELKMILLYGVCIGTVYSLSTVFSQIYQGGKGKNGSTIAGTSVVSPIIPIAVVLYLAYLVARTSKRSLLQNHPCLFVCVFGFMAAKVTIKLVVASMSKSPLEFKDACMFGGIIQVLNIQYGSRLDEYYLLWAVMVHVVFDLFRYCIALGSQICHYMNINCFTIKKVTELKSHDYD